MKTKLGLLLLAALVLCAGCAPIFDGLIELVYKDQIDQNAFGAEEVPVTIRIGTNWTLADRAMGDLKLALVPYYEASGGVAPDWSGRIEQWLDWDQLQGSTYDAYFSTSFMVEKGYASWRLYVWQPRSGDSQVIDAGDPSRMLEFFFNQAGGSNFTLDDNNLESGPYADQWFYPGDRVDPAIRNELYGTGSGTEAMSVSGPQKISQTEAQNGGTYYYSIARYGSGFFKPVQKIIIQRRNQAGDTIYRRSWEASWIEYYLGNSYDGSFEIPIGFDNLYPNGETWQPLFDLSLPLLLEVRIVYTDGSELLAEAPPLQIDFIATATNEIAPWTAFEIDLEINYPAYFGKLMLFQVYDEYGYLARQDASYLASAGEIAWWNIAGTRTSSSTGGRYSVHVFIDANGNWNLDSGEPRRSYDVILTTEEWDVERGIYVEKLYANDTGWTFM